MADLRTALEEAFNRDSEEKPIEEPVEEVSEETPVEVAEEVAEESPKESSEEAPEEVVEKPVQRPTTWKKEYLNIWDRLEKNEPVTKEEFTKFAEYANQRENEYKKGVSVYRDVANRILPLEHTIAPYRQHFQQHGINEVNLIDNLIKSHFVLAQAPYEQKVQMFNKLAQDYGIQLNGNPQQTDPYVQHLMNQLNQVNQEVGTIKSRYEQEEQNRLMAEINKVASDVEKFPHFEMVREDMAQLLERGLAHNLETAYVKAVRMNDDVWSIEQERLLNQASKQASKAQQVAKAKATAVSPRSITPNGVSGQSEAKDRRSILEKELSQAMGGRV
jgi:hypothetical protein